MHWLSRAQAHASALLKGCVMHCRRPLQQHHPRVAQSCRAGCTAAGGRVQDCKERPQVCCALRQMKAVTTQIHEEDLNSQLADLA